MMTARGAAPFGSPTFHSISVYWTPSSVDASKKVLVKYRVQNTQQWYEGYPMQHSNVGGMSGYQKAVYRSSIVNLTPNTQYQIALTEEGTGGETDTLTLSTLDETLPTDPATYPTVTLTANRSTPLTITAGGGNGKYKIYDGANYKIDLDKTADDGIVVEADWIIIRNFKIQETRRHGINIKGSHHHIVIENCDISWWGSIDNGSWTYTWTKGTSTTADDEVLTGKNQDTTVTKYGVDHHSAIYSNDAWDGPNGTNVIIQRNKFHHPNYTTNNWSQRNGSPYRGSSGNKELATNWHPHGAGVTFLQSSGGGNIIRYNEIWSDADHYIQDGIGGGYNAGKLGFPGPDSDIYGNYVSYCNDDGFEIEGGVQNVRVWNNYAENCYVGFANAAVRIGPLYVWRNVFGKATSSATGSIGGLYNIKMGTSGDVSNMTGDQHFFNNTWYTVGGVGYLGVGTTGTNNREIKHTTLRNNIFQTRTTNQQVISRSSGSENIDFDYDLIAAPASTFPAGQEANGKSGTATYASGWGLTGTPGSGNISGMFRLAADSRGKDSAQLIPNFCATYGGSYLDVGAHEESTPNYTYGVSASFTPPHLLPNTLTFTSPSTKAYGDAPFNVVATSPSGSAVTYAVVSGPATISGATLTITGVGAVVVKASVGSNGTYAANEHEQVITVNKGSQTIAFPTIGNKSYPGPNVTLNATASSGLTVAYTVVSGPATVSGSTLTLTGTGSVTVRAGQAGDANYNAAANVDQTFTVSSSVTWSGMLEAEDATFSPPTGTPPTGPAVLFRSNASGGEVVDYSHSTGDYIQWTVVSPSSNTTPASLKFRYSSTRTGNATLKLYVNGAFVADLPFPPTGNTNTFQVQSATANFTSGNNTVRLTAGGVPAPLVDNLVYEVLPSGTLQAETATLSGPTVQNSLSGYNGTGYADYMNTTGDYIEWTVNKANASGVTLNFRYANGNSSGDRPLKLSINGVDKGNLPFGPSGGWTTWATQPATGHSLVAGNNTIRLTAAGQHGPNVDQLSYTSSASPNPQARIAGTESPMETTVEEKQSVKPTTLSVQASPNPVSGTARLTIASPVAVKARIQFVNAAGAVTKALNRNLAVGSNLVEVSVSELSAGIYLVQVNGAESKAVTRLVVQ